MMRRTVGKMQKTSGLRGSRNTIYSSKKNKGWKLLWTKSHVRKKVRTLADSGCSCTIFTDRNLFKDYQPYSSPISTAGGTIRSTGRGTVGKLQNCLYVPEMNVNLISTGQVLKQIPSLRFILEDGIFIADLVYEYVDDLAKSHISSGCVSATTVKNI